MRTLDCRGRAELSAAEAGEVAAVARAGGVVLFPTDTLYGLGADPRAPGGIERVCRLKGRPAGKPLPVLLADPGLLARFAAAVPAPWEALMRRFWPGPLTLLFPARPDLPPGVRSAAGEVALRVPGGPLCRSILRAAGGALTGTSANRAGAPASGEFAGALRGLAGRPELAVDAGTLPPSPASTMLGITGAGEVVLLREGKVDAEALAGVLGTRPRGRPAG